MVGDSYASTQRRGPEFYNAPTQPVPIDMAGRPAANAPTPLPPGRPGRGLRPARRTRREDRQDRAGRRPLGLDRRRSQLDLTPAERLRRGVRRQQRRGHARPRPRRGGDRLRQRRLRAVRAVALRRRPARAARARSTPRPGWCCSTSTAPPASRTSSKAWRSTTRSSSAGRRRSGSRCPSWSPRRPSERAAAAAAAVDGEVGWVCPPVSRRRRRRQAGARWRCRCRCPGCSTGARCRRIDAEACGRLSELFRSWIPQDLDMRWLSGDRLFTVLQEAAPTGVRDADPAFWQLRLDALRMANRPDQFDEAAIDYCVTYEVSPPSWEPARCMVRISGSSQSTTRAAAVGGQRRLDQLPRVAADRRHRHGPGGARSSSPASWSATSAPTLTKLDDELGKATIVNVSCARLIRVDFIAAGDLLNWVLAQRTENRTVQLRRHAPHGGAVLRRDGHQRARDGQGPHRLSRVRRRPARCAPGLDSARLEPAAGGTICSPWKAITAPPSSACAAATLVAIGGDGQVTLGNIVVKATARKVRRLYHDRSSPASPAPPPTPSRCSSASRRSSRSTRATCCARRSSSPRTGAPTACCAAWRRCSPSPTGTSLAHHHRQRRRARARARPRRHRPRRRATRRPRRSRCCSTPSWRPPRS